VVDRRRQDHGVRPGVRDEGPQKVSELLGAVLDEAGVRADLERVSALQLWAEAVGEKIASVTHARSVSDGTLIVEVRSSAWLMELNMMKREILGRVNRGLDAKLEKLVFVLSPTG
jgi:predicted nucleic acid-binding Zn ribbon protein